jgi:hypothetical protein
VIEVTAWSNGRPSSTGAGYGLKISETDRDRVFKRDWRSVQINFPDGKVSIVNIEKASFWDRCRELISVEIGKWMLSNRFAPWPRGKPPKFVLLPRGDGVFDLKTPAM